MNLTHLHLLITHLPIFGSVLGLMVLAYGLWCRSRHTIMAAYLLFVVAALGAGIAYATGEVAEEAVERLPGIARAKIDPHEDFAIYALWSSVIMGVTSLIGLLLSWKKSVFTREMGKLILLIAAISFSLAAYTAYLGGQIRHSEVSDLKANIAIPTSAGHQHE